MPEQAGGVLGQLVARLLVSGFGAVGATLFLLALALVALTLAAGVSWFRVMDRLGALAIALAAGSVVALQRLREWNAGRKARGEREEVRKVDVVRQTRREPIRIEPKIEPIEKSERASRELQIPLFAALPRGSLPPLSVLDEPKQQVRGYSPETLEALSRQVELKLKDFRIDAQVVGVYPGPVITRFEMEPAAGVRGSQISNLDKDIARGLSVVSVRVVDVIPGKTVIGLEIPNANRETVYLSEILRSKEYDKSSSPISLALGKDIGGRPVVVDLARMPHLLVAGTTGSGKSVALNAMVLSLLYKASANDVRVLMIDPKMLELSVYQGIPHLLAPVVTDMKDAANALRWCVAEMERRYKLMSAVGVRNLAGFNRKVKDAQEAGQPLLDPLFVARPRPARRQRAAAGDAAVHRGADRRIRRHDDDRRQEGRGADRAPGAEGARRRHPPDPRHPAAVGRRDHRPDQGQHPDPHRLPGLEQDRLAHDPRPVGRRDPARPRRHALPAARHRHARNASMAPSSATRKCIAWWRTSSRTRAGPITWMACSTTCSRCGDGTIVGPTGLPEAGAEGSGGELDELYDQAVRVVTETRRASISGVQRRLKIGYNRAARLIEEMEAQGVVSPPEHNGNRTVLAPPPPRD